MTVAQYWTAIGVIAGMLSVGYWFGRLAEYLESRMRLGDYE